MKSKKRNTRQKGDTRRRRNTRRRRKTRQKRNTRRRRKTRQKRNTRQKKRKQHGGGGQKCQHEGGCDNICCVWPPTPEQSGCWGGKTQRGWWSPGRILDEPKDEWRITKAYREVKERVGWSLMENQERGEPAFIRGVMNPLKKYKNLELQKYLCPKHNHDTRGTDVSMGSEVSLTSDDSMEYAASLTDDSMESAASLTDVSMDSEVSLTDDSMETADSMDARPKEESLRDRVIDILRTGKVYDLYDVELAALEYPYTQGHSLYKTQLKMDWSGAKTGEFTIENIELTFQLEKIGSGSAADVYKFKLGDEVLPVVLKRFKHADPLVRAEDIRPEGFFSIVFSQIDEFKVKLYTEGEGRNNNCGIMQSYYVSNNGQPAKTREKFMILEYGDDITLDLAKWARFFSRRENTSEYQRLSAKILYQIADQIMCLENFGAFHFDIKFGNIVVVQSKESAMLIDLGGISYHCETFNGAIEGRNIDFTRCEGKPQENFGLFGSTIVESQTDKGVNPMLGKTGFENMDEGASEFISSLAPIFIEGGGKGLLVLKTRDEAIAFNLFCLSLFAIEFISIGCDSWTTDVGRNYNGLCWRGYRSRRIQVAIPETFATEKETLETEMENWNSYPIMKSLAKIFIDNMTLFGTVGSSREIIALYKELNGLSGIVLALEEIVR